MRIKQLLKYTILGFIVWPLTHFTYIIIDGCSDSKEVADVAVILGNKVNKDGSLSERLKKRLECGLGLYKSGRVKKLIVSGGIGKEGFFEGDKMRDFLLINNVPDSVIIVDNEGNNTNLTVKNTLELKDKFHFQKVIIVSQYYHITRTKMLFSKAGLVNVSGCSPSYFEFRDFYSLAKEFVAYYSEMF